MATPRCGRPDIENADAGSDDLAGLVKNIAALAARKKRYAAGIEY